MARTLHTARQGHASTARERCAGKARPLGILPAPTAACPAPTHLAHFCAQQGAQHTAAQPAVGQHSGILGGDVARQVYWRRQAGRQGHVVWSGWSGR